MQRPILVLLIASALTLSGCAASPPAGRGAAQPPSKAVTVAEEPTATAALQWFWSSADKEFPLFRAVASIANPGKQALEGVQVEWVAYDSDDSIVGSYKGIEPLVPAGAAIPYVAGAGGANLSGVPARVDIRIKDAGRFTQSAPTAFAVSDVKLKREGKNSYTVTAKIKTGSEELSSSTVFADVVLRGADGKIVGGDWWFSEGLPDSLSPGTSFKVEFELVSTTGAAKTAEVFATERPVQ